MAKAQATNYTVKQEASFRKHSLWQWSVWIEGTKKDMAAIKQVLYLLDPSFDNNPREVTEPGGGFRLSETSNKPFSIAIQIELKSGRKIKLQHELKLERPVVPINSSATNSRKPQTIRVRGVRQATVENLDADNSVIELRASYRLGESTRGLRESFTEDLRDDDVLQLVFDDEDETTWFCSPSSLGEVFPEADAQSRSVDGVFELPQTLRGPSTERGLFSDIAVKFLNIFTKKAVHQSIGALAADLERKQLDNLSGLYRLDSKFGFQKFTPEITEKPFLLFIHGTGSSTKSSFGGLAENDVWDFIGTTYGGNVLAFQHETLTKSPLQNVLELVNQLPQTATLHLITHSRGGLVGDILARFCNSNEKARGFDDSEMTYLEKTGRTDDLEKIKSIKEAFANRRIVIEKFIRVACPANGTTLASKRLDNFFNITANLIGVGTGIGANPVYGALKNLIASAIDTKNDADVLPGLEAMNPESPFIKVLNSPGTSVIIDNPLIVISGNCTIKPNLKALLVIASKLFYFANNDLVVNTRSMYQGTKRERVVQYLFDSSGEVDHFHYFKNPLTAKAIGEALKATDGELLPDFKTEDQTTLAETSRNAILNADGGQVFTNTVTGKKPIVVLLPGIMGSNLMVQNSLYWINYWRFITGGLMKLEPKPADGINAVSLVKTSYNKLVQYLSAQYDVVTFPFDWRKQLGDTSDLLDKEIIRLLQFKQPIKLIGHSMGGVLIRDFILHHPDTWQTLNRSSGFRLLFLGAPLGGSFRIPAVLFGQDGIINSLSKIDIIHTKKELLQMFTKMPGILSLLPVSVDSDNDFASDEVWEKMKAARDSDWPLPGEKDLTIFKAYRDLIVNGSDGIDFSNAVYIAGKDKATPCGYRIDDTADGKELVFLSTGEGDQSVTWETGIPKKLIDNNAVYYINVSHGSLANEPSTFSGISEILANGSTSLLSRTRPAVRGEEKVFRMPEPETFDLTPEGVERSVLGLESGEKKPVVTGTSINVLVRNGDLRYASFPVLAGHFQGDGILTAEAEIDKNLGGALSERHRLGIYPGPVGTSEILISGDSESKGAIIVGLDSFGTLTAFQLVQTIEQGVSRYLLEMNSKLSFKKSLAKAQGQVGISVVLIGSGYGGLSIESSVEAILQGVQNANNKVDKVEKGRTKLIEQIEFIELYEDRALSCFYALRKIEKDQNSALQITLDKAGIKTLFGARKRIPAEVTDGWWQRINVRLADTNEPAEDEEEKPVRCLQFSVSTGGAREEKRTLYISPAGLDDMLKDSAENNRWSPALAKTLFEMLIPLDFKEQLKKQCNINWILDAYTAAYPWELLQDKLEDATPLSINGGMIRQLATQQYRLKINSVTRDNALVVGDPQLDGFVNQLPGAEKEGNMVNTLLQKHGFTCTPIISGTTSQILQALFSQDYKIIHLAGHGVFNEDDPKSSGMLIGKNNFLSPFHIYQMSTVPELVFVNCCFLGKMDGAAEELYSNRYKLAANIGTQLIENGVKAVVVAGWEVDDEAALAFTETFYQKMFEGYNLGSAVQDARKWIYERYGTNNNTWGAYQAYGDPFYRFRDNVSNKKEYKPEFVIAEEAEIELHNLRNELKTGRYTEKEQRSRLDAISKAVDAASIRQAAITEKEALIYADLHEYNLAIEKMESLLLLEKASFSVATLEKYCNIRMKKYVDDFFNNDKRPADLVEKMDKVIRDLRSLMTIGDTAERASLMGSAYKRRGLLSSSEEEKTKAYAAAAFYYMKANFMNGNRYVAYPLTNWYELESILALIDNRKWNTTTKWNNETYVLPAKQEAIKVLKSLRDFFTAKGSDMDYWNLMVAPNVSLCLLVMETSDTGDESSWKEVLDGYRAVWNRGGSQGDKFAEIEHVTLLLDALSLSRKRAATEMKKGLTLLKEGLEKMAR